MSQAFATLRERADALREGIEEMLLEQKTETSAGKKRAELLKEAESLVSRFCEEGASDAGIATLDQLGVTLGKAKALGPSGPAGAADEAAAAELLDEAITWSAELRARALDEVASLPFDGAADRARIVGAVGGGFRASKGGPSVHAAPEVPSLDLVARVRRWDDPEIEEEEAPPASLDPRDPVRESLARIGRDTMEDLAILGGLRRAQRRRAGATRRVRRERLLANLDLLWSLDVPLHDDVPRLGVPRGLFRYTNEWALPDWGRAFALSFGLGCCDSEAALRWVLLAMRRAPANVLGAYVAGLAVGSNPFIDRTVLAALRSEEPPELLAALLEVAERRGAFEASAVAPLLAHPATSVKLAALRACRAAPEALGVAFAERFLGAEDATLHLHAADELARRNKMVGVDTLREILRGGTLGLEERTVALRAIALAGLPRDETLVLERSDGQEDYAVWVSFYGKPSHAALLLRELETARSRLPNTPHRAATAERAVLRMTGMDPTNVDVDQLMTKVDAAGIPKMTGRVRRGAPYAGALVLDELLDPNALQGERRILLRELALVAAGPLPAIDLDGFFARQVATLSTVTTT
ncbi:MAG: hypothetical protein U0414_29140 [Polyangiaceae bacterium]